MADAEKHLPVRRMTKEEVGQLRLGEISRVVLVYQSPGAMSFVTKIASLRQEDLMRIVQDIDNATLTS